MAAVCSVCLRGFSVTAVGLVRVHGPHDKQCASLGKPPRPVRSPQQPSATSVAAPSAVPYHLCRSPSLAAPPVTGRLLLTFRSPLKTSPVSLQSKLWTGYPELLDIKLV